MTIDYSIKMDKIAANNHFVVLKKEIKKSKAMVTGNLVRKLNKHTQYKFKTEDEEQVKKIDARIERIYDDIKLLKKIDPYDIAKKATCRADSEYWYKLVSDSKAKSEDILVARVIVKNNIQKQVAKFRTDHKDCDEWLNEYIEYREKKKELMRRPKKIMRQKFDSGKNSEKKRRKFFHDEKGAKKRNENDYHFNGAGRFSGHEKSERRSPVKSCEERHNNDTEAESIHPSWESKRKEKELLKAAFSGQIQPTNKLIFHDS